MLISVHYLVIPVCLFLAALFAASEASLFSLSRAQLEGMKTKNPAAYTLVRRLVFRPEATLSTLVIGNECLNIAIGTSVTVLLQENLSYLNNEMKLFLGVLISSALLLTFSEILPKIIAFRMPAVIAAVLVYPMTWAHFIFTPFRQVFLGISQQLIRLFGLGSLTPTSISEKDFLTMVEVGEETGTLDRDEKEMIFNVFKFSDLSVGSVLTPWSSVFFLYDDLPSDKIFEEVRKRTFSRIPLVSRKNNRVTGVLYTKELLKTLVETDPARTKEIFKEAIFDPYFVSSHKKVTQLFREFKLKKVHIALVVDEFGRQLGIVTLEDLLGALFKTHGTKKADGT